MQKKKKKRENDYQYFTQYDILDHKNGVSNP